LGSGEVFSLGQVSASSLLACKGIAKCRAEASQTCITDVHTWFVL